VAAKPAAPKPAPGAAAKPVAKPAAAPKPQPVAAKAAAPRVEAKLPVRVGLITHYYPHVDAGIVRIERGEIKVGDTLHVRGHTTDFYQRVDRMELDRQPVQSARAPGGRDPHEPARARPRRGVSRLELSD
jgi:hypothetical protein